MTANEKKIEALFEELVPMSGAAQTVAGEIVRAINRICYRNWKKAPATSHRNRGPGGSHRLPRATPIIKRGE